ncbi:unnamed protein product [Clonostachys rosea]|uniref:tRNA (guanine(37)-N1)-methyltransferase n=1 Tax=Bionectria ochroleuca TaxID=29856 RepID=A0ABY6U9K6_BIOOC|nr:unnamed protein product [Clonostachys rosea]
MEPAKSTEQIDMATFFRAPAARAMKTLDKSLFTKVLPTSAALVSQNTLISRYRKALEKSEELIQVDKFSPIAPHPDPEAARAGKKCLVLKPHVDPASPETWSSVLRKGSEDGEVEIIPFQADFDYTYWRYLDIMKSILPEELHDEIPSGFNTAGHVAHLNLREQYRPYKEVIGQIIVDKNPAVKTVINKIDDVGTANEFRTFNYEVLAGEDDLVVEVTEADCVFKFDYSKVYWNSKLSNEHQRLIDIFKPGEVVADVMAGIGPFAVPAGRKGVFVWANDKNPESYKYLEVAIARNKVSEFVRPFNHDGHSFIRDAADSVLEASKRQEHAVVKPPKPSRKAPPKTPPADILIPVPPTISHFVMNLPASALEFLHNFSGLYFGNEQLFAPHTKTQLPLVHAHCFAPKLNDDTTYAEILGRIEKEIGVLLQHGDGEKEGQCSIIEVRDVAPNKRMFCASFRLPGSVAFAPRV